MGQGGTRGGAGGTWDAGRAGGAEGPCPRQDRRAGAAHGEGGGLLKLHQKILLKENTACRARRPSVRRPAPIPSHRSGRASGGRRGAGGGGGRRHGRRVPRATSAPTNAI